MPSAFSWPLTMPPTSTSTASEIVEADYAYEVRGLLLPFQRDNQGDFSNGVGADLLLSNARLILCTRCTDGTIAGELEWEPEFGSLLYKLRHQNITPVMTHQATAYVVDALARWERRLRVTRVAVEKSARRLAVTTGLKVVAGRNAGEDHNLEVEVP